MRNIRLTLQYDGSNFAGWQSQKRDVTIQSTIEEALERLTGIRPSLIGAGRTDAGVHALMQVASFKTESAHPCEVIERALNAMLPADIRVVEAADAPLDFSARYSAKGKIYFYLIANMDYAPPFVRRYSWHVPHGLDIEKMALAGESLIGEMDFKAYMGAGSEVKTTVRKITALTVESAEKIEFLGFSLDGRFIKITVAGDGFLRHMVRNIVGTLVEVGRGRIRPGALAQFKDRTEAGPTAPAQGLFLLKTIY